MTPYVMITEFAPPDLGGIQATVGPILEALGESVMIISPQPITNSHGQLVRSLFSGRHRPRWWWLVAWLFRAKRDGLQVAIFGHYSAAVLAGYINRRLFGLEYVVLVHGNDLLSEKRRWLQHLFMRPVLQGARFIGVNSSFVEQIILNNGVRINNIIYTHPFVRLQDVQKTTASRFQKQKHLLAISRLVPRKNIAGILRALSKLQPRIPDLHLDIIGDGPERHRLELLAAELQINDLITFHGPVTEIEKWRLFQQADIFVMAPIVRDQGTDIEGLGLVYLEAAAYGLPVVASDTGGISDAVIDKQTGLLVDPMDIDSLVAGIESLLQHPELARQYGLAGLQRVRNEFTDQVRLTRFFYQLQGIPGSEQPKVSVIIPVYQAAETIGATLQALFHQTYTTIEVILVDDGSTDNLQEKIQPYISSLVVLHQPQSGAPAARNLGDTHCSGSFVLFLDADTVLEPTAIEQMVVALATHPRVDFVYSDFIFGWKKFHLFEYSSTKLRQQNYIHTSSLMRKKVFPGFDPVLKRFQDWDLWLTLDEQGKQGVWIDQVLFRVTERQRDVGMSSWLPSVVYRLPWIGQGRGSQLVKKYREAEQIIRKKHQL